VGAGVSEQESSPDSTLPQAADRETAAERHERLELRLWLRVLTCVQMIETTVRARLRTEFDTTLPRFDVLAQLDAAEAALTMGELSARLMVTSGNVTGLIDAMESEGLVARQPHPTDRRSTLIGMTAQGRDLFDRMAPAHAGWIEAMMAGMSHAEVNTLMKLMGRLKASAARGTRG
jgi:DNA-binding MarR family transcriptional regulator